MKIDVEKISKMLCGNSTFEEFRRAAEKYKKQIEEVKDSSLRELDDVLLKITGDENVYSISIDELTDFEKVEVDDMIDYDSIFDDIGITDEEERIYLKHISCHIFIRYEMDENTDDELIGAFIFLYDDGMFKNNFDSICRYFGFKNRDARIDSALDKIAGEFKKEENGLIFECFKNMDLFEYYLTQRIECMLDNYLKEDDEKPDNVLYKYDAERATNEHLLYDILNIMKSFGNFFDSKKEVLNGLLTGDWKCGDLCSDDDDYNLYCLLVKSGDVMFDLTYNSEYFEYEPLCDEADKMSRKHTEAVFENIHYAIIDIYFEFLNIARHFYIDIVELKKRGVDFFIGTDDSKYKLDMLDDVFENLCNGDEIDEDVFSKITDALEYYEKLLDENPELKKIDFRNSSEYDEYTKFVEMDKEDN